MHKRIGYKNQTVLQSLKNVFSKRNLIFAFVKRDIKVQYTQTSLGLLWMIFQPFIAVAVYTIFFNKFIELDTGMIPYPLFVFSGYIFWQFFTFTFSNSGLALINNQNLISKISFPKLIPTISKSFVGLTGIMINIILLCLLFFYFGFTPTIFVFILPILVILILLTATSGGIWLSALTYKNRDLHHAIPIILNYGIWLTPVFFPVTIIPEKFQFILFLNPVAGIIEWFRWSLFGGVVPDVNYFYGLIPIFFFLISGLWYFNRIENKIIDTL